MSPVFMAEISEPILRLFVELAAVLAGLGLVTWAVIAVIAGVFVAANAKNENKR